MKTFNYVITDEVGIHARPAGMLVKEAKKYASDIMINKAGKKADAKKLMMLMTLGVKCKNFSKRIYKRQVKNITCHDHVESRNDLLPGILQKAIR